MPYFESKMARNWAIMRLQPSDSHFPLRRLNPYHSTHMCLNHLVLWDYVDHLFGARKIGVWWSGPAFFEFNKRIRSYCSELLYSAKLIACTFAMQTKTVTWLLRRQRKHCNHSATPSHCESLLQSSTYLPKLHLASQKAVFVLPGVNQRVVTYHFEITFALATWDSWRAM